MRPSGVRLLHRLWVAAVAFLIGLSSVSGSTASAQGPESGRIRVEVGVEPGRVTVGDPFTAVIRIATPPGYRVEYGDFPGSDTLQALSPVTSRPSASGDLVGIYSLVAWVAGTPLTATIPVRLVDASGVERVQTVSLRLPEVASVLPPGDDALAPQPAKGLYIPPLFAGVPWWWWLLILLGALLSAALAYWLLKRRERAEEEVPLDPREWALAQLAVAEEMLPSDYPEALVARISWVVRSYLSRVHPELGPDLTTTEVLAGFGGAERDADLVARLATMLNHADRVKFARYPADAREAATLLGTARDWVTSFPPPIVQDGAARRAA